MHNYIHVAWEWEWDEEKSVSSEDDCDEEGKLDHVNPYLSSDSEESKDDDGFQLPYLTHTVTFKCIGTTHDQSSQETLSKVSQLLKKEEVPVNIFPEPTNEHDSRAICFKCQINGEWKRIGYVVREAVDHVHAEKKIISVKFSWVKYGASLDLDFMQGLTSQRMVNGMWMLLDVAAQDR